MYSARSASERTTVPANCNSGAAGCDQSAGDNPATGTCLAAAANDTDIKGFLSLNATDAVVRGRAGARYWVSSYAKLRSWGQRCHLKPLQEGNNVRCRCGRY